MFIAQGKNLGVAMKWLPIFCLLWPSLFMGQTANPIATANQRQAHQVLAATIQALGGQGWIHLRTMCATGRNAAFFHGDPTGIVTKTTETTAFSRAVLPPRQRIDLASKGQVVKIYVGGQGWEITYRGKRDVPAAQLANYLRWRDHSLGVALRQWYADPATVLMDGGQALVERRLVNKVTLISRNNDSIALEIDAATHLPLRSCFRWRDPQFHDKNLDAVEYDNYREIDGMATPFTITQTHNGETVRQRYLQSVRYNVTVPEESFDPDRAAAHLKK